MHLALAGLPSAALAVDQTVSNGQTLTVDNTVTPTDNYLVQAGGSLIINRDLGGYLDPPSGTVVSLLGSSTATASVSGVGAASPFMLRVHGPNAAVSATSGQNSISNLAIVIDASGASINGRAVGITASGSGVTLQVNTATVTGAGQYEYAVAALSGAVVTLNNTNVSTADDDSFGIAARGGQITMTGGTVSTGGNASAMLAETLSGNGSITASHVSVTGLNASVVKAFETGNVINLSDSSVTEGSSSNPAQGYFEYALYAQNGGTLNSARNTVTTWGQLATAAAVNGGLLTLNGDTLITHGAGAQGLLASEQYFGPTLSGTLQAQDISVTTWGDGATGAEVDQLGVLQMQGNSSLNTKGNNATGLLVQQGGQASLSQGAITTLGTSAAGVLVDGSGSTLTLSGTTVGTAGQNAPGVMAQNGGQVNSTDSSISVSGAASVLVSQGNGTVMQMNHDHISAANANGVGASASDGGSITLNNVTLSAGLHALDLSPTGAGAPSNITVSGGSLGSGGALIYSNGGSGQVLLQNGVALAGASLLQVEGTASQLSVTADATRLSGDASATSGNQASLTLQHGSDWQGAARGLSAVTLDASSNWTITGNSQLDTLQLNGGTLTFLATVTPSQSVARRKTAASSFTTLALSNLSGGGLINMNTVLAGSNSPADLLQVSGSVAGSTRLAVTNQGGSGALTTGNGILLVQLGHASAANAFSLVTPLQAGAYQYLLYQGGPTDANSWFLRSTLPASPPPPTPVSAPVAQQTVAAWRPAVVQYSGGPWLDREFGYANLANWHERVGDSTAPDQASGADDLWGRWVSQDLRASSDNRFDYDNQLWLAQFGKSVWRALSASGVEQRVGILASFGGANMDASDAARGNVAGLDTHTGHNDLEVASLGGYYTRISATGGYLDVVAQASFLHNAYTDATDISATQHGQGAAVSVEIGQPFALAGGWRWEPQAQLAGQYLHLDAFADRISTIDSTRDTSLRGRVGLRLLPAFNNADGGASQPWLALNLLHDFSGAPTVTVSNTDIAADFARTWITAGAGLSTRINTRAMLYLDGQYQRATQGEREGVALHAGLAANW
ncbi:outer membrane autotransporter protein [Silvimonas terrae]|uniref:Outer membrane autotransporter protein n=1 Tax=Silvimonas terrae TaxID=300266 RepID=A0A840RH14_9NEIS|nr:autotransporter outer membrane beta-barrel domain-containing protein [Silvimonas terrae]MBB5191616.1 outer membrane autotransporter protein [Silvimonas terrae]